MNETLKSFGLKLRAAVGKNPNQSLKAKAEKYLSEHDGKTPSKEFFQYLRTEVDSGVITEVFTDLKTVKSLTELEEAISPDQVLDFGFKEDLKKKFTPTEKMYSSWADIEDEHNLQDVFATLATEVSKDAFKPKIIIPESYPEMVKIFQEKAASSLDLDVKSDADKKISFTCKNLKALETPEALKSFFEEEKDPSVVAGLTTLLSLTSAGRESIAPWKEGTPGKNGKLFQTVIQLYQVAFLDKDEDLKRIVETFLPSLSLCREKTHQTLAGFVTDEASCENLLRSSETLIRAFMSSQKKKSPEAWSLVRQQTLEACASLSSSKKSCLTQQFRTVTKLVDVEKKDNKGKKIIVKESRASKVAPVVRSHGIEFIPGEKKIIEDIEKLLGPDKLTEMCDPTSSADIFTFAKRSRIVISEMEKLTDDLTLVFTRRRERIRTAARALQNKSESDKDKKELLANFYSEAALETKFTEEHSILPIINIWLEKEFKHLSDVKFKDDFFLSYYTDKWNAGT